MANQEEKMKCQACGADFESQEQLQQHNRQEHDQ